LSTEASCKRTLEITVPVAEVESETERVVSSIQKKVRLPGFRPGHAPAALIRSRYKEDIRQEVLDSLLPKYFRKRVEDENLQVVGSPGASDVHFEAGEPLTFKIEFEVAPQIELKEYEGVTVVYQDPVITDEDVAGRLEALREQKAEYVDVESRPLSDGDYAVVALKSISGVDGPPVQQDELVLRIGDEDSLAEFSTNLRGVSPGEEREFDVTYPEEYAEQKLAGRTVRFQATVKTVRRKDLPEINDEFAHDLGDYKDMGELRETIRRSLQQEKEYVAQRDAKEKLVETLVDANEFPVPEALVERQIEMFVEQYLRSLAARGVDPKSVKLDWEKVKTSQRDKAVREVKGSLILSRVAEKQGIDATIEEVDHEVQRIARQQREPVPAVRAKFERDGTLRRIASHIRTEKILNFLFERATKVAQ
jgi:trigger factor